MSSADDTFEGQAFYLDDLDTKVLPVGWHMDEHGYLQLTDRNSDYCRSKPAVSFDTIVCHDEVASILNIFQKIAQLTLQGLIGFG